MQARYRIFMGATALLYLGPLMAGLGGTGLRAVPAFAAVFILWMIVMRPNQWPRRVSDWKSGPALIQVLSQSLMQLVLVTALFALGRAIGGALGLQPDWPGYLPLAISFLSVPLGRLIWDPRKSAEVDQFLDSALTQIRNAAAEKPDHSIAMAMLAAMPKDLSDDQIAHHLVEMEAGQGPAALWQALQEADDLDRQRAIAIFATDAARIKAMDLDIPARAFAILPDNPDLLAMFARRSLAALGQDPDLWDHFPNRERLSMRLPSVIGTMAEAPLRDLLAAYDRISPA